MNVVISQSMYFPWVGLLEQIRLADVFMHYDDVQLSRGFYNRVQVKTRSGTRWMTVPLRDKHQGQRIDEVRVDNRTDWRSQHRDILRQACLHAPFVGDMLSLVDGVFAQEFDTLADVSRSSILALAAYFGLDEGARFVQSTALDVPGASSERLHGLCQAVGATRYITGHGALNYLDHALFERSGIDVAYMDYRKLPYPQQFDDAAPFTPFVTGLDLVANLGREGQSRIVSEAVSWRAFTQQLPPETA
jgi:WbqC-like protein family